MVLRTAKYEKPLRPKRDPVVQFLATDDRAFDAKIVRGALEFLGRFIRPLTASDIADAGKPFAWVPETIRSRAAATGKTINRYPLADPATADECNSLATVFRIAVSDIQERERLPIHVREGKDIWLSKKLATLELVQRPIYRDGHWLRVTIPALRSVEQCMAYALLVIREDRWSFRDRVHLCPYRKRSDSSTHFEPDHWFLDVDEKGAPNLGAPQRFCTEAHSNAFRQREWRRQQATAKHK